MRRALPLSLLGVLTASAPALAQSGRLSLDLAGDTVFSVKVGATRSVDLVWTFQTCLSGVSHYDVTFFYDASSVQIAGAAAPDPFFNLPAPTVTTFTDSARVVAGAIGVNGINSCTPTTLASLRFAMAPTATTGSLVSMRINSIVTLTSTEMAGTGLIEPTDVCQAVHIWGDIDDDGAVTSRDALIALTAAVGLPTPGFDLSTGDVDRDGLVTSRDALIVLSTGVGLFDLTSRAAVPIPHLCAPLAPAPSDLLYWTPSGLALVASGDTVPTLITLPLSPDEGVTARLNHAGTRIMYSCLNGNTDICVVDRNGANLHTLVFGLQRQADPTWSPDDQKIAFQRSNFINSELWIADSSGANPHVVITSPPNMVFQVGGWNPAGGKVLFTGPNVASTTDKLFQGDTTTAGNSLAAAFNTAGLDATWTSLDPRSPAWRQVSGGDSVAYRNGSTFVVEVAAAGSSGGPVRQVPLNEADAPAWTAAGIAVSFAPAVTPLTSDIYLQVSPTGRILRLTRSAPSAGATRPSLR